MANISNNTLVICFGVLTLLVTVAGLHYRDSLCCMIGRSLVGAWTTDNDVDIEAMAGLQHTGSRLGIQNDDYAVELQPLRSIPLYLDDVIVDVNSQDNSEESSRGASISLGK
ncbi:hypothetical protein NX059_008938 [Plenodomus lindquistii]|nr:hypothetical protein NX059_008938 [Plenodomus lindquistii]